ncbi:hypothetical protein CAP36_12525 [Chitinophagaceae bacterium IBVUCB2]|nr:hypothetical protein CAP36_12525 [Chitinophagaceae bacterium IBVUCB2]
MSSAGTNLKKEKSTIFSMVLSSPGMSENCKIVLQMSRQNVLLLSRLIETGILNAKGNFEDEILSALPEESAGEFKIIHEEILKKSGLTDFYEKLKSL